MVHASHDPEQESSAGRRRIFPLSLRTSLVLVVLLPIAAMVGFASTTAAGQWSSRSEAVNARATTVELDSLMQARAAVTDEYVATAAIVFAAAHHVTTAKLDALLGINFAADISADRRVVDRQLILRTTPSLVADYDELLSLRSAEARGELGFAEVQSFFGEFTSNIDALWLSSFGTLSKQADSSAPQPIRQSLAALRATFTAFTSGLQQATLAQAVLTSASTSAQVEKLIDVNEQFQDAVQSFRGQLGRRGAAAWQAFQHNPQIRSYDVAVQLAINVGLRRDPPPYASNLEANAGFFKADVIRVDALTDLVLADSADLRAATTVQENATATDLVTDLLLMALLLIVALGGALVLSRSVGQPLARIVSAAGTVRAGGFDLPALDESGPKELALAAEAFNEMSSTLRGVEAHAVALAGTNLDDPVLASPLPGRTGGALQTALDQLRESMRANEQQRDLLHDRATHDSLTGLLNRGAAVDALGRDLARARRAGWTLALLFIDLDGLKAINDTFGHEGGDAAIRAVADTLRATTRQSDVVARLGGDEFVVAWLGAQGNEGPSRLAERIRQQVSRCVAEVNGSRIAVRCSIGVALSEPSDVAVDSLMNRADQALYLAKAEGRDKVRTLDSPPDPAVLLI